MLTTICITILAYMLLGKEIKPLLAKLEGVDWRRKASDILDPIKVYANRVGRTTVRPVLQLYYVLTGSETTLTEKAMLYAAVIYTVMPQAPYPNVCSNSSEFWTKVQLCCMYLIRYARKSLPPSRPKLMLPSRNGSATNTQP